jgi:hypothetical protein
MKRRDVLTGFLALLGATGSVPRAMAQDRTAEGYAVQFLTDLVQVASGGQPATVREHLRPIIDMQYAFDTAFAGIRISDGQRERLTELMLTFLAREAILVAEYAQGGQLRAEGSRSVQLGTKVDLTYRDSHGPYPLSVLLVRSDRGGGYLVRDFGSERASSVVTKLAYVTNSLQAVTSDTDIWIRSFEEVLSGA